MAALLLTVNPDIVIYKDVILTMMVRNVFIGC